MLVDDKGWRKMKEGNSHLLLPHGHAVLESEMYHNPSMGVFLQAANDNWQPLSADSNFGGEGVGCVFLVSSLHHGSGKLVLPRRQWLSQRSIYDSLCIHPQICLDSSIPSTSPATSLLLLAS